LSCDKFSPGQLLTDLSDPSTRTDGNVAGVTVHVKTSGTVMRANVDTPERAPAIRAK
jgi:hypothetical protein